MKPYLILSLASILVGACVTTWTAIEHSLRVAFLAGLGTFFCTLVVFPILYWMADVYEEG